MVGAAVKIMLLFFGLRSFLQLRFFAHSHEQIQKCLAGFGVFFNLTRVGFEVVFDQFQGGTVTRFGNDSQKFAEMVREIIQAGHEIFVIPDTGTMQKEHGLQSYSPGFLIFI